MRRSFALALLLLCPLLARADIRQYIDEQTFLAAEADLTRIKAIDLEPAYREILSKSGLAGGKAPVLSEVEVARGIGLANAWLTEVERAGGKKIYLITHFGLMQNGSFAIIAPSDTEGNAKKLASLLYSGRRDGPTSRPGPQQAGRGWTPPRAEVINGNVAVWGTPNAIAYARMIKAAARPDLEAALKAVDDMPVKVVVAPPQMVRGVIAGFMPETIFDQPRTVLTQELQWIAAGGKIAPPLELKAIAQASSADAARQLHQIVTYALSAASGVPPDISPDMAKLLTPTLANDQLTLSADKAKLIAIATEIAPQLREAKKMALVSQSMSNMRQILMACNMYAAENNGKWPDDLKALDKYLGGNQQVFVNPRDPQLKPAYIYIKPVNPRVNTSTTVVLYESHKDFATGVGAGFVDGHVEFITDKNRFDELLAQTEVAR